MHERPGAGVPEIKTVFLDELNWPFGIALIGNNLYVANTERVLGYAW
jgi:glucose/arabinose dehydrogenase